MKTQFLIAAPTSGSGKTTVARGLMAAFRQQGYTVQPFKCGPDYIDTKFHEAVCGRPSVNLDTFMATPEHIRELFARYSEGADVCIVEGMMGMYDGYDRDYGSSSEIARVLGLPIVLVVNARSAAYSMAPLLQGFLRFREDVHVAGVIFNQVGSSHHEEMLRQVCDDIGIQCFGFIPKSVELEQGSRYLGLDFSGIIEEKGGRIEYFEPIANQILKSSLLSSANPSGGDKTKPHGSILVARNKESFSFIYQEMLDNYEHVTVFDPEQLHSQFSITHSQFDLLYLPGGYPEKHLEALVKAEESRQAIKDYAEQGGPILAECGGMMYLCKEIVTDEGSYPMCGVLPYTITARKADRKLSLGYRRFVLNGQEYRGHEFHYTQFLGEQPLSACQVYNAKGTPMTTPVIRYKNVLASYTHLYPKYENDIYQNGR